MAFYELGVVVPKRIDHFGYIDQFIGDKNIDLPGIVHKECQDLLKQIDEQSEKVTERTRAMSELSEESDVEAFASAMETFHSARDFAVSLGLVPRHFSSGGKERLGRVSKLVQADLRRLLTVGAMSHVGWAGRKPPIPGKWMAQKPIAIHSGRKMF